MEGQQIVVGGDILLAIKGFTTATVDGRAKIVKALEILQVGQDLRVSVLRGDKIVELSTKFAGF